MRRGVFFLLTITCLLCTAYAAADQKSASSIFTENRMAVVHVEIAADPASRDKQPSYGTGFVIGSDGYILTAKHILSSFVNAVATPISVRIGSLDGPQVAADYLPFDIGLDVAILKLRSPIGLGLTAYRTVQRGDSTKVNNGDTVFVLGFNLTSNLSVAQGLIASTLGGGTGGNLLWDVQGPGVVFGMSGAPVFDSDGSVIGIVEGGQPGSSGIIFVYPEQLLENFAVIPGWRRVQPLPPTPSNGLSASVTSGNAIVMDGNVNYDQSGFSFVKNQTVAWNSPDADILVATADRSPSALAEFFLPYDVPPYAAPQDAGAHSGIYQVNASNLGDVATCPSTDYKYHWFPARQGGTYCVRMRSGDKYVRIKVQGIWKDRISFDWATLTRP